MAPTPCPLVPTPLISGPIAKMLQRQFTQSDKHVTDVNIKMAMRTAKSILWFDL